jgi:hypothetical protein
MTTDNVGVRRDGCGWRGDLVSNRDKFAVLPNISKLCFMRIVCAKLASGDCKMMPFLVGMILVMRSLLMYFVSCCSRSFVFWYFVSKLVSKNEKDVGFAVLPWFDMSI